MGVGGQRHAPADLSSGKTPVHIVTGRIMSIKNSNYTIGNRTEDNPACSAVPQSSAPPRAPIQECRRTENVIKVKKLPPDALYSVCMHLAIQIRI